MAYGTGTRHSPAALARFSELVARHDSGEFVDFERELQAPAELSGELRELHTSWLRLVGLLDEVRESGSSASAAGAYVLDERRTQLLELLARFRGSEARYEVLDEIARGGMGVVLRVRERGIERELALKRLHDPDALPAALRPRRMQMLRRLLDEAWILSRLDHPGILPLHELGVDEEGRVYFTMPLVRGRTLTEVFELARAGQEGWSVLRALELLQRVCEALALAHSLGIVHRDLKPANVMVGRFGEVLVMDWGLARAANLAEPDPSGGQGVASLEPSLTLAGDVLGTPQYMAPEQARGDLGAIGPHSDVYAAGAMLYELLAGQRPYHAHSAGATSRELLEHIRAGPPERIEELARKQPAELVAICRRAMQRDPAQRHAGMSELAEELRAFREGRVVRSFETGPWAELKKWIGRNRRVAAAAVVAGVSLLGGVSLAFVIESRAERRLLFEADLRGPAALEARAVKLWPVSEARIPEYERWLAEAHDLLARRELYQNERLELCKRALPVDKAQIDAQPERVEGRKAAKQLGRDAEALSNEWERLRTRPDELWQRVAEEMSRGVTPARKQAIRLLLASIGAGENRFFSDPLDQRRFRELNDVLDGFSSLEQGHIGSSPLQDVERRLEWARTLRTRSLVDAAQAWSVACAEIADPNVSPAYAGLVLRPQLGLVPIGRDPRSGLYEFAELASGAPAQRRADGTLDFGPDSGIVFVLVPAGRFWMGAVRPGESSAAPFEADPLAGEQETPAFELELAPFFLSKYELTQGQWQRLTHDDTSYFGSGAEIEGVKADLTFPAESMTWKEAAENLGHFGLSLPTEAQWEYAARAGTHTRWWWGEDPDAACARVNRADVVEGTCPADAYVYTCAVNHFEPNPWGFHCILGNVAEWTQDSFWSNYRWDHSSGNGAPIGPDSRLRVLRGGSFRSTLAELRVSARAEEYPDVARAAYGLRPARALDR